VSTERPLTDAEQAAMNKLGWTLRGGGIRDDGSVYVRARHTSGRVVELSRREWRGILNGTLQLVLTEVPE